MSVTQKQKSGPRANSPASQPMAELAWNWLFAATFGGLLGLALLKFGNPINLDRLIDPPKDLLEFVFQPWPLRWGYAGLFCCAILAFRTLRFRTQAPTWIIILPLVWFGWQTVSASTSIDTRLTHVTLLHFGACLCCFYLGLFGLSNAKKPSLFWCGLLTGFVLVLWSGFGQHYGGLEATRKMFYEQADWQKYPAEYIRRIEKNRIFATLVYPNALAGAILLLLAPMLAWTWRLTSWLTPITRGVLVGLPGYGGVVCIYWTGSRSGWLIGLVLAVVVLLYQRLPKRLKIGLVAGLFILGLTGFFVKFASYFSRGAPSVSARFDYWRAGVRTALDHPIFGTGPGTFSVAYKKIKPPDAEMAQLVHNDYLEQACDSGIVGFLAYTAFMVSSVLLLGKHVWDSRNGRFFPVWLGLLGWALQSSVEFLLYIPALAWPVFTFLGLLWARAPLGFDQEK